jgi:nondiscriminating glutamyl-tRNA synthetase
MFRTRQAPSPTGYLHIGTARTVLFTKLFAKINQGIWYLRLEDTDQNRLQKHSVKVLLGAMDSIGLKADEGVSLVKHEKHLENPISNFGSNAIPLVRGGSVADGVFAIDAVQNGDLEDTSTIEKTDISSQPDDFYGIYQNGSFGPYIQSHRLEIYHEHAQKLIDQNLAYWSFLTPEDKQQLQEIKQVTKRPVNYYKVCSEKFGEKITISVQEGLQDLLKPVLMYRLQRDEKITCHDELLGDSTFDLSLEEDFTILKSDGFALYHLAHLVDDHLMKTTCVIRSQEWFPSFPKHYTMFTDYWQQVPQYLHLPFVLGENGNKKMSKRDGNVNLQDYLDKGFMPEAIINYLTFLGWNPGTDKEIYLNQENF